VTVIGLAAFDTVPSVPVVTGEHVAVKFVIGSPPGLPGVNPTSAAVFPAVTVTAVGAPGAGAGVAALDGADGKLGPLAFVATTVQVYASPFVSPVTTTGLAVFDDVPGVPALTGEHVAVKFVIGLPFWAPGVNPTDTCESARVAVTVVGASGTGAGANALDATEATLVPAAFVAVTVHVYESPLTNGLTTIGIAVSAVPVCVGSLPLEQVASKC